MLILKISLTLIIMFMIMNLLFMIIKKSIHPMIMLSILIIYTLLNSVYLSKWLTSFFFSYLMFMVFIGGILITFLYIVSLTNKDKYNIKLSNKEKMFIYLSMPLLFILILYPINNYFNHLSIMLKFNEINQFPLSLFNENIDLSMKYMYSYTYKLTIMSIFILLFMLISVVKICSKHSSPLRQIKKFYEKIFNKN